MSQESSWVGPLCRVYSFFLYAYPREFRARFAGEMRQVFRDRCLDAARGRALGRFTVQSAKDWLVTSVRERFAAGFARPRGWITALAAFVFLFIASATLMHAYVISAGSMEGSLRTGDHVVMNRVSPHREIRRGDIVAFLYPDDPRQTFVKRVIGLPGDRIRLIDKQVIRNGRRLIEPYTQHVATGADPYRDNFPADPVFRASARARDMLAHHVEGGEVIVPPGSLFVLGDNRDNSLDSRYWGFVPRENVVATPLFVYWSYDAHLLKTRWERTLLVPQSLQPEEVEP